VIGPAFLQEENERAFRKIEESVRQYCAHSRDSVSLIRRPLSEERDHFALVWSHGVSLVAMYPYGGIVQVSKTGRWQGDAPSTAEIDTSNGTNHPAPGTRIFFDNPHATLVKAFAELASTLDGLVLEHATAEVTNERYSTIPQAEVIESAEPRVTLIALFTSPVREFRSEEPIGDPNFAMMTLDYAVSRTIVHMPNILRVAEQKGVQYTTADLEILGDSLQRSAQLHASRGVARKEETITEAERRRRRSPLKKWALPVAVLIIAIVVYLIFSGHPNEPAATVDSSRTTPQVSHRPSTIVLELPQEVELFVSPNVYTSRLELDRALARGEGQRYLPDTQQVIQMDSVVFAKGVYGYFKVNDVWRKGKLLETLHPIDTIRIVEFLDPLH